MCGIAGKISLGNYNISRQDLALMAEKITHRGPDDEGFYISEDRKVGLANRRLAIIDLTKAGHQPMNYLGRYWITYNGEVYNYRKEREGLEREGYKFKSNTDTEVVLALYDKYKFKCLNYLRGMFAFAIYDNKEKILFLARDRIGQKPLKYYWKNNVFIFASELKAILTQGEVKKEPDWIAIDNFLTYGFVPSPATGFKNINKLEPGHYLIMYLNKKLLIKRRYWQPDYSVKLNLNESEWSDRIINAFKESTKLRLIADVPVGAFLSGGVDSSAVVAIMASLTNKPIKTFTIGFKEKAYDERKYAHNISRIYRTDHTELIAEPTSCEMLSELVYKYEEPFADSSNIVTYMVSKLAKQYVTVILNGDGGDENFAGYDRYSRFKRDVFLEPILPFIRPLGIPLTVLLKQANNPFWSRMNKYLLKSQLPLADRYVTYNCFFRNDEKGKLYEYDFKKLVKRNNSYKIMRDKFEESKDSDISDKALYSDLTLYFPDMLLTKVDIASMGVSLEARSPFLDQSMIELACKIPFNLKLKGRNQYKYILKKALENIVPAENIYRPKKGFSIPLSNWFSENLNDYSRSILLTGNTNILKIVKKEIVEKMLNEHTKENDFGPQLWALTSLELWFERFFG